MPSWWTSGAAPLRKGGGVTVGWGGRGGWAGLGVGNKARRKNGQVCLEVLAKLETVPG